MRIHAIVVSLLLLVCFDQANAASHKTWEDISNVGVASLLGASVAVPLIRSDRQGLYQAAYSIGAGEGVAILGKALIKEDRPDHSDNNSFPSGHTTVAFASATSLYKRYGWQTGLPAYAVATLTGSARVASKKHHWWDVVAGAAIGTASGWYFTDAFSKNVAVVPWVDSKGAGVQVSMRW